MTFKFIKAAIFGTVLTASSMATAGLIITSTVEVTDNTHALDGATFTLTTEIADGAVWGTRDGWLVTTLSNERLVITGASGAGTALNGEFASEAKAPNSVWIYPYYDQALFNKMSDGNSPLYIKSDNTVAFIFSTFMMVDLPRDILVGDVVEAADFGEKGEIVQAWYHMPWSTEAIVDNRGDYTIYPSSSSFAVESMDVPEPSTLAIFTLGLMGLASRRFKKKS